SFKLREIYEAAGAVEGGWIWTNEVTFEEFAASMGHGFDRLFLSRSGGKRWIDASAENLMVATPLALMFPKAKFIHLRRDGRSVVRSMLASGLSEDWANDFSRASQVWKFYSRLGRELKETHGQRVLDVGAESLA